MRFSILMPLFNHANYVRDAIDSALTQSFTDLELLVTDDGSTDNSLDVVSRIRDSRLQIFSKENGGCVSALNCSLTRATGDFICWLSADDVYAEHKLEMHSRAIDEGAVLSIAQWGNLVNGNKVSRSLIKNSGATRLLPFLSGNWVNGLSVCSSKELFYSDGVFESRYRYAQDFDKWIAFIKREQPVFIECESASFTRIGSSFLTRVSDAAPGIFGEIDSVRVLFNRLIECGFDAFVPDDFAQDFIAVSEIVAMAMIMLSKKQTLLHKFGLEATLHQAVANFVNSADPYLAVELRNIAVTKTDPQYADMILGIIGQEFQALDRFGFIRMVNQVCGSNKLDPKIRDLFIKYRNSIII